jgi:hypothetical protein
MNDDALDPAFRPTGIDNEIQSVAISNFAGLLGLLDLHCGQCLVRVSSPLRQTDATPFYPTFSVGSCCMSMSLKDYANSPAFAVGGELSHYF